MLFYIALFLLVSTISTSTTFEKGGGGFIDSTIGKFVKDGVASGVERDTYFENNYYTTTKEVGAYYATWGVYSGRDYQPHQVPVERLTHLYVAFAGICGNNPAAHNGGSGLRSACSNLHSGSDSAPYYIPNITTQTDGEASFSDDTWGMYDAKFKDREGNSYSQFEGMMKWKDRNENLKVIWTVGGWSYSRPFFQMASTEENRQKFVNSIVNWLSQPSMAFIDGIDIDWEFPGGLGVDTDVGNPKVDGANYLKMIKTLRSALDTLGEKQKKTYQVSTAIGVGPPQLDNWAASGTKISELMPYLDRLGLMTYDFAGAFSDTVGFVSALSAPSDSTMLTNVEKVMNSLKSEHGIQESDMKKISLGVAFYGRSQELVGKAKLSPGDIPNQPTKGSGGGGTIEAGTFSYFDLFENYIGSSGEGINGYETYYYPAYGADLLYNESKGQVISYQTPRSIEKFSQYVLDNGMRGVFSWEVDDDNGFLLETIHTKLSTKVDKPTPSPKKHIYAPDCKSMTGITLKPGMLFSAEGRVYNLNGWATKCPNEGESWEKQYWVDIGAIDDFVVYGASEEMMVE